jgi:hypothetical protein
MARLTIDLGTTGNSATGDSVRGAFNKCNLNFQELYNTSAADGVLTTGVTNGDVRIQPNGTGSIEIDQLKIDSSAITSIGTNSDITITANGTGNIVLGQITIADNVIKTNTSNSNLQIDASGTGAVEILTQKVIMANLPTSAAGLATGQLYNDGGTLKIA